MEENVKEKKKSGLATASLVLGILSLIISFLGLIGLPLGIVALNKKQSKGKSITGIVLSSIAILFFVFSFSEVEESTETGKIPTTENTETQDENSNADEDNIVNVGEYIQTDEIKISFLSAEDFDSSNEFIEPKEGYKFFRVEFEFENVGESDFVVSSMMDWNCYADDYSMEQTWFADDVLDATISSGKKAKGAIYFEVPVNAESITVEYITNLWTEDKIIFIAK